ncbi:6-hydroxymethylpterin diphosphokinase MptE-like protein [Aliiglaciecola lipolytica]|uniref:DUF115 domain-containing protein n=1 Tax=Aliiglaciecola lipolytica E3 TaxID=1127673 RepID=K6X3J7_9ALTE|nr:6-hydroxymethylpterin diphosphokinase MptE-like protein [Aliiglaciecola lipolytica]GAC15219.1 hypothetical protein GLIP_2594 [Aliiglaciecola lipolytica E3]
MLKNIRLHLEKDEEKQKLLEKKLASTIIEMQHKNINSFARNIPSLVTYIKSASLQNHSIFCNKFGEFNIVDYGIGRTLYGFHPKQEVLQQLALFKQHATYISFSAATSPLSQTIESSEFDKLDITQTNSFKTRQSFSELSEEVDCMVVLGCGLGFHILQLLQSCKIKNLIIYEPEPQYFQCSVLVMDWNEIFSLAKSQGTQIFIQLEKDGRDLTNNISELREHVDISGFYLYQHYNHPVFDSLHKELTEKSWQEVTQHGISFSMQPDYNHYLPTWTPPVDLNKVKKVDLTSQRYTNNLAALKKYYPNIFKEFEHYQPKIWLPVENSQGEINLIKKDSLTPWYSEHPLQDCIFNYDNFSEQPHKDGLVLGYTGTKLAHYLHYQFVKETEALLIETEEEISELPDKIASIILFGLGAGYQLETLLQRHSVEMLFLCEPNTDFFYASLFAIDWETIFSIVEESNARIYLNIGDDGTNLFRDLLNQFHSIGPYILNDTYFYQSYYNASLNTAIAQLREQLQVVISMGEYFDHAFYGIEHTKEGMRRNYPILTHKPANKLSYDSKEVPIFIIGNGPSLDSSVDEIKEWQDKAIIVSCGTALQALHRHKITPDFHAEIEQNRSTFDWATLVGDVEFLKNITLISCNGIHPDTSNLYKDTLIAFKEGESSTVSAQRVLGNKKFSSLQHAFPTVSNFVCDLFSNLGFSNLYLLGVDLGFINVKHHHSLSSGYYQDDGEEITDYTTNNNTSLVVPGNFRSVVNTKHEFKVSRQIIEQVIYKKPKQQNFYNCSDGAKIEGAIPLRVDNILIVSTESQKQAALLEVKTRSFSNAQISDFIENYEKTYSHKNLMNELGAIEKLNSAELRNKEDVKYIINKQKEMLFASYQSGKSLLFYYLYGTTNYVNAVFTKFMSIQTDQDNVHEACTEIKNKWLTTIGKLKSKLSEDYDRDFDSTSYSILKREMMTFKANYRGENLVVVSDSSDFNLCLLYLLKNAYPWVKNTQIITPDEIDEIQEQPAYCIYNLKESINYAPLIGTKSTIIVNEKINNELKTEQNITQLIVPHFSGNSVFQGVRFVVTLAVRSAFNAHNCSFILPKFWTSEPAIFDQTKIDIPCNEYISFAHTLYICAFPLDNAQQLGNFSAGGSRGRRVLSQLRLNDLVFKTVSQEQLDELIEKDNQTLSLILQDNG